MFSSAGVRNVKVLSGMLHFSGLSGGDTDGRQGTGNDSEECA